MKRWLLIFIICISANLQAQQGGVKSFQAGRYSFTEKSIQNISLNNSPSPVRIQKILFTGSLTTKNTLQQTGVARPKISLNKKGEPVSTLGNQIDFFNTAMLEHIITGESDITLFKMSFKGLGLAIEASENKITSTSLTVETIRLPLPAITFRYEPGNPSLFLSGFILDF